MQGNRPVLRVVFNVSGVVLGLARFDKGVEVLEEGGVYGMALAFTTITEVARVAKVVGTLRHRIAITAEMAGEGLHGNFLITDSFDLAGSAGEAGFHEGTANPNGFKRLGALIGRENADTHFGHDFEHALLQRGTVILHRLQEACFHQLLAALDHFADGLVGKIRADGLGTITKNSGGLMGIAHFARIDDETKPDALPLTVEVVMHRSGGQQGRDGDAGFISSAVTDDKNADTVRSGLLGFGTKAVQRWFQPGASIHGRPRAIQGPGRESFDVPDGFQLMRPNDRAFQMDDFGVIGGFGEDVAIPAQRH